MALETSPDRDKRIVDLGVERKKRDMRALQESANKGFANDNMTVPPNAANSNQLSLEKVLALPERERALKIKALMNDQGVRKWMSFKDEKPNGPNLQVDHPDVLPHLSKFMQRYIEREREKTHGLENQS